MTAKESFQSAIVDFLDVIETQNSIYPDDGDIPMIIAHKGETMFFTRRLLQIFGYQGELPAPGFGYIDLVFFLCYFAKDCDDDAVAGLLVKWRALVHSDENPRVVDASRRRN